MLRTHLAAALMAAGLFATGAPAAFAQSPSEAGQGESVSAHRGGGPVFVPREPSGDWRRDRSDRGHWRWEQDRRDRVRRDYSRPHRYDHGYHRLSHRQLARLHRLPPGQAYRAHGNRVVRIDTQTGQILAIVALLSALGN